MSAANPHFNHIERAPYEFGHLIRNLPAHFPQDCAMSADDRLNVEAAIGHAHNANYALLNGIEAIGSLLYAAANNANNTPDSNTLENLGTLIKHVAVQAQFFQEQQSDLQSYLDRDDRRSAGSPLRQKAAS